MSATFRAAMLAGASLCVLVAAGPAGAQQSANERVYRQEALAHARAVTTAWRRLEGYILAGSAGTPDPGGASVSGWTGPVPPADSGWLAGWTLRGVRARYCEDTLLVYLAPERLKGVGRDHRAVQAAPHAYAGGGVHGQAPVLHWLENGEAAGAAGRPSVTLPACLSDTSFGGPLPSGRAALAGTVRDPYTHMNERVTRERRIEACAAGEHGEGRTSVREAAQTHDGRGNPVGDPVYGPWQVLIDECRADYTSWETYTLACHWDAGPPHNRRMEGREIWRRKKSVTADGETLGPPEFVSTGCWTGEVPTPPMAVVTVTAWTEAQTDDCPSGYTGSRGYRRTATRRATQFPWDAEPVVQINHSAWILETDNCRAVIAPDWSDDSGDSGLIDDSGVGGGSDVGGDHDVSGGSVGGGAGGGGAGDAGGGGAGGAEDGGAGGAEDGGAGDGGAEDGGGDSSSGDESDGGDGSAADDSCDQPYLDAALDACILDSIVEPGGEEDEDSSCFLTTAVVERRGAEADDGPTLTALRRFRDGYMMQTPERRALVAEYYGIAPRIAAAIPRGHSDWDWIGARIDAALAAIAAGRGDGAFAIYAAMVRRLAERWTAPAGGIPANTGTGA